MSKNDDFHFNYSCCAQFFWDTLYDALIQEPTFLLSPARKATIALEQVHFTLHSAQFSSHLWHKQRQQHTSLDILLFLLKNMFT